MPPKLTFAGCCGRFSMTAVVACALALAGCAGPIVRVSGSTKITPELPSAGNNGPLLAMTVPGGSKPERDGPLIAVVDVDGLLLEHRFHRASARRARIRCRCFASGSMRSRPIRACAASCCGSTAPAAA